MQHAIDLLGARGMLLRAIEEKRFLPVGSDMETESDFQLIAGTNRDLPRAVAAGSFREDLLARINLWTFRLAKVVGENENDVWFLRRSGEDGRQNEKQGDDRSGYSCRSETRPEFRHALYPNVLATLATELLATRTSINRRHHG